MKASALQPRTAEGLNKIVLECLQARIIGPTPTRAAFSSRGVAALNKKECKLEKVTPRLFADVTIDVLCIRECKASLITNHDEVVIYFVGTL